MREGYAAPLRASRTQGGEPVCGALAYLWRTLNWGGSSGASATRNQPRAATHTHSQGPSTSFEPTSVLVYWMQLLITTILIGLVHPHHDLVRLPASPDRLAPPVKGEGREEERGLSTCTFTHWLLTLHSPGLPLDLRSLLPGSSMKVKRAQPARIAAGTTTRTDQAGRA